MTDIADELFGSDEASALTNRAGREITALRARVAELEAALEPFAAEATEIDGTLRGDFMLQDIDEICSSEKFMDLTYGDFRRARAALRKEGGDDGQ